MYKIYTTYFAKVKDLPNTIMPISIAALPPKGWEYPQYKKLAPSLELLTAYKRNNNQAYYIKEYQEKTLDKLNQDGVLYDLFTISLNQDIALVCYEKPENFCHRQLVAEWLRNAGFEVQEYEY